MDSMRHIKHCLCILITSVIGLLNQRAQRAVNRSRGLDREAKQKETIDPDHLEIKHREVDGRESTVDKKRYYLEQFHIVQ